MQAHEELVVKMLRISLCQNGNYFRHRNILRYPVPFITVSGLHSSLRLKEIYEVDPRASEYLNLYLFLLHPLNSPGPQIEAQLLTRFSQKFTLFFAE